MCGGTPIPPPPTREKQGLSPRVRGNHKPIIAANPDKRSIPACAGEPAQCKIIAEILQVYPRVCGGTRVKAAASFASRGLSPRVRGNRLRPRPGPAGKGSIPACAGEPSIGSRNAAFSRVYPRVCGGTATGRFQAVAGVGLSPRVRGNQPGRLRRPVRQGSIPACAGEPPDG